MMARGFLLCALVACAAAPPEYRGNVAVRSAQLVTIDPDVKVVADSDKPMFFAANAYWMFHDAGWYRGASVRGPWVREQAPPWQVRKIDQPYAFTHYVQRDQTAARQPQITEPHAKPAIVDNMRENLFNFD
jgi:hypothetical protein